MTDDPSQEAADTVDDLAAQGDKLGEDIEQTKSDWQSKQESSSVPGAVPDTDPNEAGDAGAADDD